MLISRQKDESLKNLALKSVSHLGISQKTW